MKLLLQALSSAADGAMLVDPEGRVAFWNLAAERLFGFRAEEVKGRPCHEVFCGLTLAGQPVCSPSCPIASKLARGCTVRNFDMQSRTKAGRTIWLNVSSLSVPTRKKDRFLAVHLFRDITRLAKVQQLEEKLHSTLCSPLAVPEIQARPPVEDQPPEIPTTLPLSKREREVLQLLALGHSSKMIADALCISPTTVRNHIQHILEKLGVHSRLQALAMAFPPGQRSSS